MFEGPHATNIFGDYSFQWWRLPVSLDRGGRVRRCRCILLGWRGFRNAVLIFQSCQKLVECLCDLFGVLSSLFVVLISLLIVGFNGGFNGKELVIGLGIHIVNPFWHFETWGRKSGDIWRRWALMCK